MPNLTNRVRSLSACLLALAVCVMCARVPAVANPPCPSDLDGDGSVGGGDLALVLLDWGDCPVDPPTITAVSPSYGPTAGGTAITIIGTALTGTTGVTVRGNAATSVVVVNDTTVTAVTPPGALGAANVAVTTLGGTATISGAFTYGNSPAWCTVLEQTPNASVVTNATLRAAITATGLPWRVRDKGTDIEMVLIPPGTFTMGCSASASSGCWSDESPTHLVTIGSAFYMSRTEVTQSQWTGKMGSNPSGFMGDTTRPVEQVSWIDTQSFCSATGMRLPTEAEWEYAYRAGSATAFHGMPNYLAGTDDDNQFGAIAWFASNSSTSTHPVATKAANGFGLFDMAGNVYEWVSDWYGGYTGATQTDPTGPLSGSYRCMRGGSWANFADRGRSSARSYYAPSTRDKYVGFRVARNP